MKKVVSTIFAVVVMATLATPVKADNSGVEGFVKRLYQCVLGRTADKNGLNYWMNVMKNGSTEVVLKVSTDGFFHSNEFLNKKLSNGEFVKVCYRTFLGREAEANGYNYWMGKLNTASRDEVIKGFAYSNEFANIMKSFGLGTTSTVASKQVTSATTSTTKTVTTVKVNVQKTTSATTNSTKQGNAGRLSIPSVNFEVPLYSTKNPNEYQKIVDDEDSALYTSFLGKKMIADHAHQGFRNMRNVAVGAKAYITVGNEVKELVCTAKYTNAVNNRNGISINGKDATTMNDGSLYMYTCNDSTGKSVTVTFWNFK